MRPIKGDALACGEAQGIKGHGEADTRDSISASGERGAISHTQAEDGFNGKAFETIRAELALKGYGLHCLTKSGGLLIVSSDGGRTVHANHLDGAARFLAQIGGQS